MTACEINNRLYHHQYPMWLELYEEAIKDAADAAAKAAPQTGDPMTDYKARAEAALCLW
jgi:hypothetical protein